MRILLASTAVALLFSLSPASAAMCGGGSGQQASGGMCGVPAASKQLSDWPDAPKAKPEEKQSGMGMCGCCKNMASMGDMKADDPHKGMEMPKQ